MKNNEFQLGLAHVIFPGYSFFGFEAPTQLCVSIGTSVDCLSITIESASEEFLNLGGISLIGGSGETLELDRTLKSARLSSTSKEPVPQDVLERLMRRKLVHSGKERHPRLMLNFKEPIELSSLRIANRLGIWSKRSRHLTVSAWRGIDQTVNYQNYSSAGLLEKAKAVFNCLDKPFPSVSNLNDIGEAENVQIIGNEIREEIIFGLSSGTLELDMFDMYALLPIFEVNIVNNENIKILLGEIVAKLVERGNGLNTAKLRDFQMYMNCPDDIECIRTYASRALERKSKQKREVVFSKHRIAIGASRLKKRGDEYASALQVILRQFEKWSITSMICYGTLLGAVRNGEFIEHDDDVDMLILDKSSTRGEMISNSDDLIARLQVAGFKARRAGMNFHVVPPGHTVTVDIFPSWQDTEGCWVMMERGEYRNIPKECLLPVKSIKLRRENFTCPSNSEAFLANRYGSNWQESDPYHEWPWPITQPASC